MIYSQDEKKKIIEFLNQTIKLVESGDICNYKNMTDTLHMEVCISRRIDTYTVTLKNNE